MTELITKTCIRCNENKPLADFPKYSRHCEHDKPSWLLVLGMI